MTSEPTIRELATGLILAGGRGARLGGRDKGLVRWRGRRLVEHLIEALAPQVSVLLISANRNLEDYRALGRSVLPDAQPGFPGPLAGMLAGALAGRTPWTVCVPCDTVPLPADAVARLIGTAQARTQLAAYARCGGDPLYPLCAFRTALAPRLRAELAGERRSVRGFLESVSAVPVDFSDAGLRNLNTPEALEAA